MFSNNSKWDPCQWNDIKTYLDPHRHIDQMTRPPKKWSGQWKLFFLIIGNGFWNDFGAPLPTKSNGFSDDDVDGPSWRLCLWAKKKTSESWRRGRLDRRRKNDFITSDFYENEASSRAVQTYDSFVVISWDHGTWIWKCTYLRMCVDCWLITNCRVLPY
jgi:hypothetical protein